MYKRQLLSLSKADTRVLVLNTREREVVVRKGSPLGKVFAAHNEATPTGSGNRVNRIQTRNVPTAKYQEVIDEMISDLPPDLNNEQKGKIRKLLMQYRTILSTSDHDVGCTPLVEHTIDTGNHRPIRQPLRRQPFQHQAYIDEETNRMLECGIIEPAASPWASNVVLVKKKDGTLRFCVDYRRQRHNLQRQLSSPSDRQLFKRTRRFVMVQHTGSPVGIL